MMRKLTLMFAVWLAAFLCLPVLGEDTDIFKVNSNDASARPNILFILDNTANWNTPFNDEMDALQTVFSGLTDQFNIGVMFFNRGSYDGGYVRAAIKQMTSTNRSNMVSLFSSIKAAGSTSTTNKGNNASGGLSFYESYLYYAGGTPLNGTGDSKYDYLNNTSGYAADVAIHAATPNAVSAGQYVSPIADGCQKNYIIFLTNGPFDNNEHWSGTAGTALRALDSAATILDANSNGTAGDQEEEIPADEWAKYLATNGVPISGSSSRGLVYTYTIDVISGSGSANQRAAHSNTMKNIASFVDNGYFKFDYTDSANLPTSTDIADAIKSILQKINAVNSVFASSSLPVSVNVRGTYLNQVYMGLFRPDGDASPRWPGNLKQYKLGYSNGNVVIVDRNSCPAQDSSTGFVTAGASSFWTTSSTFWDSDYYPAAEWSGVVLTPGTGGTCTVTTPTSTSSYATSDMPDEGLVEKGGAAERLRNTYASSVSSRNVYTCNGSCTGGSLLSATPFSTSNANITDTALGLTGTKSITSLVRAGTGSTATATATSAGHGLTSGTSVTISGANETEYNGTYTISNVTTNTFDYTITVNPATTATGTISVVKAAAGAVTVSSISLDYSTGVATATTSAAHGFSTGNTVQINGASDSSYNGAFTVASVPTSTTFTFPVTVNPSSPATTAGTATVSSTSKSIASITRSGTTVTVSAPNSSKFPSTWTVGTSVTIASASPTGYNGTFTIASRTTSGGSANNVTDFTYTLPTANFSPTQTVNNAGMTVAVSATSKSVTSLTRSGATATAVTSAAHGYIVGDSVVVSGAGQSAYNGTFTVASVPSTTSFTYTVTLSPSTPASGTISATTGTVTVTKNDLINWVRGQNVLGEDNATGTTSSVRGYLHGDVLHSRPAVVNYNSDGSNNDVYVFYGSNEGMIHAVKGGQADTDGGEQWAFIPTEFFTQFERLYKQTPDITVSNREYFADGPLSVYAIDANSDGKYKSADNDKVYLYVGMRRGGKVTSSDATTKGRFAYALDVSSPTAPKLLWKKSYTDSGFAELGQTWSELKPIKVKIGTTTKTVLVFGAGYDAAANDSSTNSSYQTTATMGRGIFMVDATTGELVWQSGPRVGKDGANLSSTCSGAQTAVHDTTNGDYYLPVCGMNYAITADVVPVDRDGDGIYDRLYVGDTGANVWRANISDTNPANWVVNRLACFRCTRDSSNAVVEGTDVSTTHNFTDMRKIMYSGDFVYDASLDVFMVGTGDREAPLDTTVLNRFYMVTDASDLTGVATVVTGSDLCDYSFINGNSSCNISYPGSSTDKRGWLYTLNTIQKTNSTTGAVSLECKTSACGATGEKVVGGATVVSGTIYFGTNVPESSLDNAVSCTNLGEARLYAINYKTATPSVTGSTFPFAEIPGGGLPPTPVAVAVDLTDSSGKTTTEEVVISGFSSSKPKSSTLYRRYRVYWYERDDY